MSRQVMVDWWPTQVRMGVVDADDAVLLLMTFSFCFFDFLFESGKFVTNTDDG